MTRDLSGLRWIVSDEFGRIGKRCARIQRAALEADARIRMAWAILVYGEHPY